MTISEWFSNYAEPHISRFLYNDKWEVVYMGNSNGKLSFAYYGDGVFRAIVHEPEFYVGKIKLIDGSELYDNSRRN